MYFWGSKYTQDLLLALYSRIISGKVQGTIWSARNWAQVSTCKKSTLSTVLITIFPSIVYTEFYMCWVIKIIHLFKYMLCWISLEQNLQDFLGVSVLNFILNCFLFTEEGKLKRVYKSHILNQRELSWLKIYFVFRGLDSIPGTTRFTQASWEQTLCTELQVDQTLTQNKT